MSDLRYYEATESWLTERRLFVQAETEWEAARLLKLGGEFLDADNPMENRIVPGSIQQTAPKLRDKLPPGQSRWRKL